MNNRFIIMLIIALVLAGTAAWMAKRWVDSQSTTTPANAEQETVNIFAAATNIAYASKIEPSQVKMVRWPKANVPAGAFTEDDVKADPNAIVGKVVQRDYYADEILIKPQVKEHAGGSTLSSIIAEGMRAISVRVNDTTGVAGFILPGNRADIIAFRNDNRETYTLLKNVKILAIDQTASTDQEKPSVVQALTLEVTQKQAELLVQAQQAGTLQFTLRNPADSDTYMETTEIQPGRTKAIRQKPPVPARILPWGSQNFIECSDKVAC